MRHAKRNKYKRALLSVGISLCLIVGLGFFIGTIANAAHKLNDSDTFGIGKNRFTINAQVGVLSSAEYQQPEAFEASQTSLASFSTRDISTALSSINSRIEERFKIAEQQRLAQQMIQINALKNIQNEFIKAGHWPSDALPKIDYDIGKDAFIAIWSAKINKYLEGSNLAGQGPSFAQAAWDAGVDPRWSPAISNTESSKGSSCFKPHNAWGWGQEGWPTWEEAINAHVHGLAEGYGFTITHDAAAKYCPPNTDHWFSATLNEMIAISNL